MTNEEIIQIFSGISQLREEKIKLNVRMSFNIANIYQKLLPQVRLIEDERRKILLEYGIKNEDGTITIPRENIDKANQQINELMNIENIFEIQKIKLEDFGDIDLSYEIIENLTPIIE